MITESDLMLKYLNISDDIIGDILIGESLDKYWNIAISKIRDWKISEINMEEKEYPFMYMGCRLIPDRINMKLGFSKGDSIEWMDIINIEFVRPGVYTREVDVTVFKNRI